MESRMSEYWILWVYLPTKEESGSSKLACSHPLQSPVVGLLFDQGPLYIIQLVYDSRMLGEITVFKVQIFSMIDHTRVLNFLSEMFFVVIDEHVYEKNGEIVS